MDNCCNTALRRREQFAQLGHVVNKLYVRGKSENVIAPSVVNFTFHSLRISENTSIKRSIRPLIKGRSDSSVNDECNGKRSFKNDSILGNLKLRENCNNKAANLQLKREFSYSSRDNVDNSPISSSTAKSSCDTSSKTANSESNKTLAIAKFSKPRSKRRPIVNPCCICSLLLLSIAILIAYVVLAFGTPYYHRTEIPCEVIENERFIDFSIRLRDELLGQRLATDAIISVLERFLLPRRNSTAHDVVSKMNSPIDANVFTMFFDGWTGSGKTYATDILMKYLFAGSSRRIIASLHIPIDDIKSDTYLHLLKNWLDHVTGPCRWEYLLVIDELDKASEEVLRSLKAFLSYLKSDGWTKMRTERILVVLLSSTLAAAINNVVFEYVKTGGKPEDLEYSSFERLPYLGEDTWISGFVKDGLLDMFVPFLPLDGDQVEQCVRKDLLSKGFKPTRRLIDGVMNELSFVSVFYDRRFSTAGCKRVSDKVDLVTTKLDS